MKEDELNLQELATALLNSLNIKNDFASLKTNGYIISNLTTVTTKSYSGLIGGAKGDKKGTRPKAYNIYLKNADIFGKSTAGGIVGYGYRTIVQNCVLDGVKIEARTTTDLCGKNTSFFQRYKDSNVSTYESLGYIKSVTMCGTKTEDVLSTGECSTANQKVCGQPAI